MCSTFLVFTDLSISDCREGALGPRAAPGLVTGRPARSEEETGSGSDAFGAEGALVTAEGGPREVMGARVAAWLGLVRAGWGTGGFTGREDSSCRPTPSTSPSSLSSLPPSSSTFLSSRLTSSDELPSSSVSWLGAGERRSVMGAEGELGKQLNVLSIYLQVKVRASKEVPTKPCLEVIARQVLRIVKIQAL